MADTTQQTGTLEEILAAISARCGKMEDISALLLRQTTMTQCLYHSASFWKNWRLTQFAKDLREMDLAAEYDEMVRGLDEASLIVVERILARIQALGKSSRDGILDLFTPEEKAEITAMITNFLTAIVPLGQGCYVWRNQKLPIRHFEPSVLYDKHGIHKLSGLDRIRGRDIVDAGGFIGDSALVFSPYTERKVYSFEPIAENYTNMLKTIELNSLQNVVPIRCALGAETGTTVFSVDGSASKAATDKDACRKEEAPVCCLDEYVEEHGLTVGLIKTDLEGGEQEFLRGAKKTIKRDRPALIISIYHSTSDFFHIKRMLTAWNLGYSFQVHMPASGNILLETVLIAECRD